MESDLKLWLQVESAGFQSKPIQLKANHYRRTQNKILFFIKFENETDTQKKLNHTAEAERESFKQ